MSRYNIPSEWRTHTGWTDVDLDPEGLEDLVEMEVKVKTFWVQESSTSPYGSTYATDVWYEFDDSTSTEWAINGTPMAYGEVVRTIGEPEAQRILSEAIG